MGFIIIINFIFFMMEIFRKMSKQVKGDGLLCGFRSDGRWDGGECVLHLLFADDTILFYDADVEQILHMQCCYFVFGL